MPDNILRLAVLIDADYGFLNLSGLVEKIQNLNVTREKMPNGLQIVYVERK